MSANDPESIKLKVTRKNDYVIIRVLLDEITYRTSKIFLESVKEVINKEPRNVILDLKKVEMIDSVSLGTLVAIKKYVKLQDQDCDVVITGLSMPIHELFRLLNFHNVFKIYDTPDDALNA